MPEDLEPETPSFFDDTFKLTMAAGFYTGVFTVRNLPKDYYTKVSEGLFAGVQKGFGSMLVSLEFGKPDYVMLSDLRSNIYAFGGAKTYQQARSITDLLLDSEGNKKTFGTFYKDYSKVFDQYNKNWLKAEYNTSTRSAQMARYWLDIEDQKDVLPLLQYVTVGDARVRPEHRALDGITRPVNDAFWKRYYPVNSWNCRCIVKQLRSDEANATDMAGFKDLTLKQQPEIFRMNVGVDKLIFSEKHPYFDVAYGDKTFAKDNFGLPKP